MPGGRRRGGGGGGGREGKGREGKGREQTLDSTIAPPKTSDFLWRILHGCSTRGKMTLKLPGKICIFFFVCKGLSNDDVGGARGTVFREIQLESGFKTGDSINEKLGGLP